MSTGSDPQPRRARAATRTHRLKIAAAGRSCPDCGYPRAEAPMVDASDRLLSGEVSAAG